MFTATGKIRFQPEHLTKKHEAQGEWKKVVLLETECELWRYYGWFVTRRYNLNLIRPIRGSHVTLVNDKMGDEAFKAAMPKWDGKEIPFVYDVSARTNGEHWWLRVECPIAKDLREDLGISREPYFSFHLTLGEVSERNGPRKDGIEWFSEAKYIHRCITRFENEPNRIT